uniref:Uncharacterized protein n=1 Tax=Solanum tuberosum TaxID=4113 RepID=M1DAC6_SOLTU
MKLYGIRYCRMITHNPIIEESPIVKSVLEECRVACFVRGASDGSLIVTPLCLFRGGEGAGGGEEFVSDYVLEETICFPFVLAITLKNKYLITESVKDEQILISSSNWTKPIINECRHNGWGEVQHSDSLSLFHLAKTSPMKLTV